MNDAAHWVETLKLSPHPEGGYYRRTYESFEQLPMAALPARFSGNRPIATAIYYLLEGAGFSALHRIKSDEIWNFYAGSPLRLTVLDPGGVLHELLLGKAPEAGQSFQHVVRAGCWFGAEVAGAASYSLVGCVVAPGFDFEDFELADRERLVAAYPQHRAVIEGLTRA
jgi:predicted cupin superfamily sugar epimerase